MKLNVILIFTLLAVIATACDKEEIVDLRCDSNFELPKYMGRWYEIARLDHPFERDMDSVSITYKLLRNSMVLTENRGYRDGGWSTSYGRLKQEEPHMIGGLRSSFFWIFFAPYRVLLVAPDYSFALVSSGENFLWILSRKPNIAPDVLDFLILEASSRGFDTSSLIYPEQ